MSKFKVRSVRYSDPPNTAKIRKAYEVMGKVALRILQEEKRQKEDQAG